MHQVKYFILAKNLAHLVLISHFRDILTLKQDFHTFIKGIKYKTTRIWLAFFLCCFWVNTEKTLCQVHLIKDLTIRNTRLQQTYRKQKKSLKHTFLYKKVPPFLLCQVTSYMDTRCSKNYILILQDACAYVKLSSPCSSVFQRQIMPRLQNLKAAESLKVGGFVVVVVSFVCLFVCGFFKLLAQETQGLKIWTFTSWNGKT